MTTEAQIAANRHNSLKSTGPKSYLGKEVASRNALKHGLLSKDLLIRGEQREDLEDFRDKIYESLSPFGALEELFVEKIVNAAWRLHRLGKIEVALFDKVDIFASIEGLSVPFSGSKGDSLQSMSRYESALERNFYKAIHELQRIQAIRSGQPVLAPISIEATDGCIGFVSQNLDFS